MNPARQRPLRRKRPLRGRRGKAWESSQRCARLKPAILKAQGNRCARCRRPFVRFRHDPELHHLLPRAQGGEDSEANLVALCARCHCGVHAHTVPDWGRWLHTRPYSECECVRCEREARCA